MHLRDTEGEQTVEISVVVPLFNEEQNIAELYRRLSLALAALEVSYELVLVDDGSRDATGTLIEELQNTDFRVTALHLSRNFGHQAAICAGLDRACGRAVILMDGDLQDPPEVLGQFMERWRDGFEVVYAIRTRRKEGILKRTGYFLFYRLLALTSDLDIPLDSGDFCLMDRKVVDVLKHLPERMRFVRGLRTFVGFSQVGVRYERAAREAGEPKYSFRALVRLALDGLFSFSSFPLNVITYLAGVSALAGLLLLGWIVVDACSGGSPPGWACTLLVVQFMGTAQLIGMGILAEYLRRIFIETKQRPTYIVREPARPAPSSKPSAVANTARGTKVA